MAFIPRERVALLTDVEESLLDGEERIAVVGQPGVGKSVFIEALVRRLQARGDTTVLYHPSRRGSAGGAFFGLRDLLSTFSLDEFELPEIQRKSLLAAVGRTAGPVESVHLVHIAVGSILRELASVRRLVIAIDDLDLLDDETHELLGVVSRRPRGDVFPESYVGTLTSDPMLTGETFNFDITMCSLENFRTLHPFSRAAFEAVLSNAAHAQPDERTIDDLFTRTGGNPMWAFELAYQTPPGASLGHIPVSIADLVEKRLAILGPEVTEVLAAVSIFEIISQEDISRIFEIQPEAVQAAVQTGVVLTQGNKLTPAHPMLASAAFDSLGPAKAVLFHRRIFERSGDTAKRALHLHMATPAGIDEGLANLLFDAGVESRRSSTAHGTEHLLRLSIDRSASESPKLSERQIGLLDVLFSRGELDESVAILDGLRYEQLTVDVLDKVVPLALMTISARDGEEAAAAFLTKLHDLMGTDSLVEALLTAYDAEIEADPVKRKGLAETSLSVLRLADAAPATQHRAIGSLISADLDTGLGLNSHLLEEAERLEKTIGSVPLNDSAIGQRALFAYQAGDLEISRRALETVRKRARTSGELLMAGVFSVHLATVQVLSGQLDAADQSMSEWDELDAFTSPPPSVVAAKGLRLLRSTDEDELRALIAQPHEHGSETTALIVRSALTGIAAARRQRWQEAVYELERARDLARSTGIEEPGRRYWVDFALSRTYIALERYEDAADLSAFLRKLSKQRRPLLDGVACRIDALIAAHNGEVDEGIKLLRQSVALLTSAGFPTETALSLLDLGRVLHLTRDREESMGTLARAAAIAAQAGDEQLLSIITSTQTKSGAQTAQSVLTGREQAVAADAAAGRTNREIAESHFLSVRTVETQLSSAYRKLGVRSRSELTALLSREAS